MQLDYSSSGQKKDLASTYRLLLSDEEGLNHDLSNLTFVAPETQAKLEALLEVAGMVHGIALYNNNNSVLQSCKE